MAEQFIAEINLLPTSEGGRATPLERGEWRTVLGVDGEHWSARLRFTGSHPSGTSFQASVQLLVVEALEHFPIGRHFTVWEGGTRAIGRVLSLAA